ncbi:MAG TPA: tetratricopeptide repeat protein, partial [Kofleriaceae bacterium]|nr:tetratricopeptide repeat protein [Kofleriaceae bacterium]
MRIGFLIDWLDSRPGHVIEDNRRLNRTVRSPDTVRECAAFLTARSDVRLDCMTVSGNYAHDTDYDLGYHLNVAGHLAEDELTLALTVYERLRRFDPGCLSALANLAELERRAGHMAQARAVLDEAIERAASSPRQRHRISDHQWGLALRCARARIETEPADPASLIPLATFDHIRTLADRL